MNKSVILEPQRFEDLSDLKYRLQTCSYGEDVQLTALVVSFAGEYRSGGAGNGDARLMSAIIRGAMEAWEVDSVVLDLREMRYEFGDLLMRVFDVAAHPTPDIEIPIAILISDQNRIGITNLLRAELGDEGKDLTYTSPETAVAALKSKP